MNSPIRHQDMCDQKPWLTPWEQVSHLKSKGVRFRYMSEAEAVEYLTKNNNYFRLRSYRTGFPKVSDGKRKGEYVNLDFKMLVDLSIIDMLLRNEMISLTLDIEHFCKVDLLGRIEQHAEDGYEIVQDYLSEQDTFDSKGNVTNWVKKEISRCESSAYSAGILAKYSGFNMPAWAFLEVITFGAFNSFILFCAKRFDDDELRDKFYLLRAAKDLRNACAHNSCILNGLASGENARRANNGVMKALSKIDGVGSYQRKARMSNERIRQIVTTLYLHKEVSSKGVIKHKARSLSKFISRANRNINYYKGAEVITSSFSFLSKVIGAWYLCDAEDMPSCDS